MWLTANGKYTARWVHRPRAHRGSRQAAAHAARCPDPPPGHRHPAQRNVAGAGGRRRAPSERGAKTLGGGRAGRVRCSCALVGRTPCFFSRNNQPGSATKRCVPEPGGCSLYRAGLRGARPPARSWPPVSRLRQSSWPIAIARTRKSLGPSEGNDMRTRSDDSTVVGRCYQYMHQKSSEGFSHRHPQEEWGQVTWRLQNIGPSDCAVNHRMLHDRSVNNWIRPP